MFSNTLTVSYGAEIIKLAPTDKRNLKRTIALFNDAVSFVCNIVLTEKDNINELSTLNEKYNYIERLIHSTSKNEAKYPEFDIKFLNMPAYLRRCVIAKAYGHISSYLSNIQNYEEKRYKAISNGKRFREKEPTLNLTPNISPTFYKNNMYLPREDNTVQIKLFNGKDWKYYSFILRRTDCDYIRKIKGKQFNPTLEFKNNKFYLRYAFEQLHVLPIIKPIHNRIVLAVDLGINTHAVCSVMKSDGTVIARRFITDATDKTTLDFLLNKKAKLQSLSGNWHFAPLTHIQKKINCVNTAIENYVCKEILKTAQEFNVDVIVFEHLSVFRGKSSEKVHYWRKKAIIKKVCHKAHYVGIRYATVTPRFTSMKAFDGSGFVKRGLKGRLPSSSLCKFKTGKIYNCDLNSSYNIGARYFYREFKKENKDLTKSSCNVTLSDLWGLSLRRVA